MAYEIKSKKAQLTLFIVVGLVIISVVAAVIVFTSKKSISISASENPKEYIELCLAKQLREAEKSILDGNGYLNLSSNYYIYYGEKVPFLCKSSQFYKPCTNQEPDFIGHIQKEFEKKMNKSARICLDEARAIIEKKGYSFKEQNVSFNNSVNFETISANINAKVYISNSEGERTFSSFYSNVKSPLYPLSELARVIINYESAFCEFNDGAVNRGLKSATIEKFVGGDGVKVYTITDEKSQKKIKFAVKSCILPGGI